MKHSIYMGIQTYFHDEWVNTKHKTVKDIEKEAKKFGGGIVKKLYLGSSWFEHDTFYYTDDMGHTFLFRGITRGDEEYLKNKRTIITEGNKNVQIQTFEQNR